MFLNTFLVAVFSAILYGIYWFLTPYFQSLNRPHPLSFDLSYIEVNDLKTDQRNRFARYPFENIYNKPVVHLSVIVPAYNEVQRLPAMLKQTIDYLKNRYKEDNTFTSEIIIVDDGSRDDTPTLVLAYAKKYTSEFIKLLKLPYNMGKGGAVQIGMLHARGKYVLFADADGASDFNCFPLLQTALEKQLQLPGSKGLGIAIGSRAHLATQDNDAVAERKPLRILLQKTFHFFMTNVSGLHQIKDTQCGFKLFTRETCQWLFNNQKIQRWCFDVELLFIANQLKIPITEIPINWQEIDGSKVDIASASLSMGRDLVMIKILYTLGIWKIQPPSFHQPFARNYEEKIERFKID